MASEALLQTQIPSADLIYKLQLTRTPNVGPITYYDLIQRFGSAQDALKALPQLNKSSNGKRQIIAPDIQHIEREISQVEAFGAQMVTHDDPHYPALLKTLPDAPPVLTYKGRLELASTKCIGVVGARNASMNAKKFAGQISAQLGENGVTVASGLARGIDTSAHIASLNTGTIAVVAGGIDQLYPPENAQLFEQICDQGLVLAESHFGAEPKAILFPKRNRIVSGISLGICVVEAALKSGSLITARMAGEQNRDVFAVPGTPFDPRSQGTNKLIKQGAVLTQSARDILEVIQSVDWNKHLQSCQENPAAYDVGAQVEPTAAQAQDIRNRIYEHMSYDAISIDELARECDIPTQVLLYVILELELAGEVYRHAGGLVTRKF